MQVRKDPLTLMTALTITPVERAPGVPKLVAGTMLPLTVTVVLLRVVAATSTLTKVLRLTDVTDPALTPPLRDMAAGRLEST